MKHCIVYISPAGSTRLVAETLSRRLTEHSQDVVVIDLGPKSQAAAKQYDVAAAPCCLWIGSPVYCDHAIPLVTDFIRGLPFASSGNYAVPFVTWGGVTSGLSLLEMATQLQEKNYLPLGAAKILAVHSSMWAAPQPLAFGHPDKEDLRQVEQLVDEVLSKLARKEVLPLHIQHLDYLSPTLRADAASKSLPAAKAAMPPLTVDAKRCQQCGECAAQCPVAAIILDPLPTCTDACLLCLQCVRSCPHEAFIFDNAAVAVRISAMAANSDEVKRTTIFT